MAHLTFRPPPARWAAALAGAGLLATAAVVAAVVPAGAASAAGSGSLAGAAACTPASLPTARTVVERALANRVVRLERLQTRVATAQQLSATDRGTLSTDLTNELSGIQGLQAKVPGDPACATLQADGRAMVTLYRVYTVMSPQVQITVAADAETSIVNRLSGLEPAIAARITAAKAKGLTVTAAQATFGDLESQVASAAGASSGVSSAVLAVTPAAYPGCHQTFEDDASALGGGRTSLEHADVDLHTLKADARRAAG